MKNIRSSFLAQTLLWMAFGLFITGLVSYRVITKSAMDPMYALRLHNAWFWIFLVQMFLSTAIASVYQQSKSYALAILYIIYTAINGLWIGPILFWYDATTVMYSIAATSVSFLSIAGFSYVTKKDLTQKDGLLSMGLVGLMVAMIFNMFMYFFSPMAAYRFDWVLSIFGILLFYGLLASSIQKLKELGDVLERSGTTEVTTIAIQGAFSLYLTIINVFLFILRIFGRRQ